MKKLLALMLVCLMVVPFGMLATTAASAAGKTVYLSDTGVDTAAGTDAAPVATIAKAYELVGNEGTIVIKGTYTFKDTFTAPDHTGVVTIKGADATAKLALTNGKRFLFGGETVFTDLYAELASGTFLFSPRFNDCTFTETFTSTKHLYLVNAQSGGDGGSNATPANCELNVLGGNWIEIHTGMRSGNAGLDAAKWKDIDITLNIGGKVAVDKISTWVRSVADTQNFIGEGASVRVNLLGGKVNNWICMTDSKNTTAFGLGDGYTVYIGKDFKLADSFTAGSQDADHFDGSKIFYGISGDSVFGGDYAALNKSKVIIAAELYDSLKDSKRFRDVTVEKEAAVTPPPVPTGDATWVVAAVAAVSVIGCAVVVSKKKA